MSEREKIVKRIVDLCEERGMSYYKLSYCSAVPMTTLMHIINCRTQNPGVLTLSKICSGLGISIQEFFDTEDFEGVDYDVE